jgi:biopolymer transport protein ExbB
MNINGKKLAITGSILLLGGPLFGLIGTIIGMLSAFQTMGSEGMGKPEALANDIWFALITRAIGLCVGVIGLIIMLIALFGKKYRDPWFFWFLTIYSIFWIINFPVGTVLGIGLLIFLLTHKKEFINRPNPKLDPTRETLVDEDKLDSREGHF